MSEEEEEEKERRIRADFAPTSAMRRWLKAQYNLEFDGWKEITDPPEIVSELIEPIDERTQQKIQPGPGNWHRFLSRPG